MSIAGGTITTTIVTHKMPRVLDDLEGSKGRVLSLVLAIGIVTACLIALFLFIGFGGFGFDKSVAQSQSPVPSGSTIP